MTTPHHDGQNGVTSSTFDNGISFGEDAGTSRRSNALSNKLTSVLSTSFTDTEVRDALKLLDARGAQNVEELRSNLKYEAQTEVIEANAKIVDDFGKVAKQLQRVGALIAVLNQTCDDMRSHIQMAKQETLPMLEEASTLLIRKEETEAKKQLLDAFVEHFVVSDEDLTTLTSSADPVNDRFFAVLARVKQIHKDCEILLGYENQRLGLEFMEQTSRNLDAGYKKLYSWVQREFKGLDLEDPRTSGSIRKSLRALSERPTLFKNCLDLFGEARDVTLSDAFQTALTNSTIGTAKAIEFSTHDPLRYVGDMLAWVHSATVSEKEALEGLFISDAREISKGLNQGKTSEPWARLGPSSSDSSDEEQEPNGSVESTFDGLAALSSLISRSMSSVSQTLQQRVSLTIRGLSDPFTIYKAYNLLLFYEDIFVKLLGSKRATPSKPRPRSESKPQYRAQPNTQDQNVLLATFTTLQSQCLTLFTRLLNEELEIQSTDLHPSLTPPAILSTNLNLLTSILHLRAPSLTKNEFTNLYAALVSPVIELCSDIAESLQPSDDEEDTRDAAARDRANFEGTLFRLNYLFPVVTSFSALSREDTVLVDFTSGPLNGAAKEIGTLQEELVDLLAENFALVSGVREFLNLLGRGGEEGEAEDTKEPKVDVGAKRKLLLSNHTLEDSSSALDTFLASALMDAQDDLAKLSDKNVAKTVIAEAVEEFCAEFEKLVAIISRLDAEWEHIHEDEPDKKTQDLVEEDEDEMVLLQEIYPRTVGEVRALLS